MKVDLVTLTAEKPSAKREAPTPRPRRSARRIGRDRPYLWLAPSIILFVAVFLYPIIEVIRLSFTRADLVGSHGGFTWSSWLALGPQGIWQILGITVFFVGFSIVFQMLLGFFIALMLVEVEKRGMVGSVVTRTAVMTAWAIPGVVIGIIWRLLFQESSSGILNYLSTLFGGSGNIAFLSDPHVALVSVTVANIWRGTALTMILCYAGLKTVPNDIVEAAHMDGARPFAVLRNIILPSVRPVLVVNLIIVTVDTLNTFDMIEALTAGGPGRSTQVLALSVYNLVFGQQKLGVGAAFGVVLLVVNVIVVIVYLAIINRGARR